MEIGKRPGTGRARRIGERLSYANLMASAAVFIALGGSAWALAANSVGTKQLKDDAVKSKKIADDAVSTAKIRDGAVTAAKLAGGAEALAGPPGAPGAPGSPAASMITGASGFPLSCGGSCSFTFGPSGTQEELGASQLSPSATVIAQDLAFRISAPPASGTARATLRVNEAATPLTCTITGAATSCTSGTATTTIPPASRLVMSVGASGADLGAVSWAFRALTP